MAKDFLLIYGCGLFWLCSLYVVSVSELSGQVSLLITTKSGHVEGFSKILLEKENWAKNVFMVIKLCLSSPKNWLLLQCGKLHYQSLTVQVLSHHQ